MLLSILYQGYYERVSFALSHVDSKTSQTTIWAALHLQSRTGCSSTLSYSYFTPEISGHLQLWSHFEYGSYDDRSSLSPPSISLLCDCYGNVERRLGDYLSFKRPNPAQDAKFLPQNASLFLFHSRLLFINFLNIHNIDAELVLFPLLFLHFVKYSESGCN